MDRSRLDIAKIGESLAVTHLRARGCEILAQNYRAIRGEIDLIVRGMGNLSSLWKLKRGGVSNSECLKQR